MKYPNQYIWQGPHRWICSFFFWLWTLPSHLSARRTGSNAHAWDTLTYKQTQNLRPQNFAQLRTSQVFDLGTYRIYFRCYLADLIHRNIGTYTPQNWGCWFQPKLSKKENLRQLIFWPLQLQNIEQPDLAPNLTMKGFEVHQTPPKLQVFKTLTLKALALNIWELLSKISKIFYMGRPGMAGASTRGGRLQAWTMSTIRCYVYLTKIWIWDP